MSTGVDVTICCDEVKQALIRESATGEGPRYWDYIGLLLLRRQDEEQALSSLLNARCLNPNNEVWGKCTQPCRFHNENNTEVHFAECDSTNKFKVAQSWIKLLRREGKADSGLFRFYILGLDLSKLDYASFGPRSQQNRRITIYNRFFRAALTWAVKSLLDGCLPVRVNGVYHDKGDVEDHPYFPWHSVYRISADQENVSFQTSEITFINSDHRESDGHPTYSHFVQFLDVIMGCIVNLLHARSLNANKVALAWEAEPLIRRLVETPRNCNSRYHYCGRQAVRFFPRHDLREVPHDEFADLRAKVWRTDNFYHQRRFLLDEVRQPPLGL